MTTEIGQQSGRYLIVILGIWYLRTVDKFMLLYYVLGV